MINKTKLPRILVATGGTGGHIFPALAFISSLSPSKYRYLLVADKRFLNFKSQVPHGLHYQIISSAPLIGNPIHKLVCAARIVLGIIQSMRIIWKTKPLMTVSFGGYPSFPVMAASTLLRVPIIIHEPNALAGRASKLFLSKAMAVSISFPNTKGIEGISHSKLHCTGSPIRKAILAARKDVYKAPLKGGRFNILILGGSQGARIFNDVVPRAIALLPTKFRKNIHIRQQSRPECLDELKLAYASLDIDAEVKRFFDDMGKEFKQAHLVIARAGALTVSELTTVGRPALLIPFAAAADNHQLANAKALEKADAAWILTEKDFTPENLQYLLENLITHPKTLAKYATNARKMFQDANRSFYRMFESCVQSVVQANK